MEGSGFKQGIALGVLEGAGGVGAGQAGKRMGGGGIFLRGGGEVAELRTRRKNRSQSAKIMFAAICP